MPYVYAGGNPISNVDPTGMNPEAPVSDRNIPGFWSPISSAAYVRSGWRQSHPSFDNTPSRAFNSTIDWINGFTPYNVDVVYYRRVLGTYLQRWNQGAELNAPLHEPWRFGTQRYWEMHTELSLLGVHSWSYSWYGIGGPDLHYFKHDPLF